MVTEGQRLLKRIAGDDVMVADEAVFPLLEMGQHVNTPMGPGTIVDIAIHAGKYGDRIEMEPPAVTVELDDEEANPRRFQVCICKLGLENGEHEALIGKEFSRLWPPIDNEIPESAHQLVDVEMEEIKGTMKTSRYIRYAGRIYKRALTQKEIDRLNDMTDEDLDKLSDEEVHGVVEAVSADTLRLQKHVKGLEGIFKRVRSRRLLAMAEQYGDAILEYDTILARVTTAKPSKPWSKILKALLHARPEMQELVDDLTAKAMAELKPTQKVTRHRIKDEPAAWKKMKHEKVPLKPLERESAPQRMDEKAVENLLNNHLDTMADLLDELEDAIA